MKKEFEINLEDVETKEIKKFADQMRKQNKKSKIRTLVIVPMTFVAMVMITIIIDNLGQRYNLEFMAGATVALIDYVIYSVVFNYLEKIDFKEQTEIIENNPKIKQAIDTGIKKKEMENLLK